MSLKTDLATARFEAPQRPSDKSTVRGTANITFKLPTLKFIAAKAIARKTGIVIAVTALPVLVQLSANRVSFASERVPIKYTDQDRRELSELVDRFVKVDPVRRVALSE